MPRELFTVKKKLHIDINNVVLEYRTTDVVPGIYYQGKRLGNIGYLDEPARTTFRWNKKIDQQDGIFKVSVLGPTIWDCMDGMVAVRGNAYAMIDVDAQRALQRVSINNYISHNNYIRPTLWFGLMLVFLLVIVSLKEHINQFIGSL